MFNVGIGNLGKYNEGELVGKWLNLEFINKFKAVFLLKIEKINFFSLCVAKQKSFIGFPIQ